MKLFLLAIFLLLSSTALASSLNTGPVNDISGHYRCRGTNFLNNTTFDEDTILTKTGDTYYFTWINKNLTFFGTAIRQENILSAVFWTISTRAAPGVVTYQVLPNGDLKGKWTIQGAKKVGDEYCEKLK